MKHVSLLPVLLLSGSALMVSACGDEDEGTGLGSGSQGSTTDDSSTDTGGAAGGGANLLDLGDDSSSGTADGATTDIEACDSVGIAAETSPVDMFIMLDQSSSMEEPLGEDDGPRRWDAVRDAIATFVQDDGADGIGVALGYFGDTLPPYDCNADDYSTPVVGMGELPSNANDIVDSMADREPTGFTPTHPALEGAIDFARDYTQEDATREMVVVLATDGLPSSRITDPATGEEVGCNDSINAIADLAREGFESNQRIRTFIIGISDAAANVEAIADAGGGQAFIIGDGDLQEQFLSAMLSIVSTPLSCELPFPQESPIEGEEVDPALVAVTVTNSVSGVRTEIPRVESASTCDIVRDGRGWFYDDPQAPESILLCDGSCVGLGAGVLNVEFGCSPIFTLQ